jgi:hypothetical protein
MTFGRPTTIRRRDGVALPLLVNDTVLHQRQSDQDATGYSDLHLFIYSCKLFDILHDLLVDLNETPAQVTNDDEWYLRLFAASCRINTFREALPDVLDTNKALPPQAGQDLVLQRRALNSR